MRAAGCGQLAWPAAAPSAYIPSRGWSSSPPGTHPTLCPASCSCLAAVGAGHCPARIDYLLTSGQPLSAELALAETGRGFSFSDHLGVLATLRFGSESSLADDDEKDGAAGAADEAQQAPGSTGSGGATRSDGGSDGEWQEVGGRSTGARSPPQRQQQQQGQQQQLGTPGALAGTLELMRMRPAPFQHAASALEEAATEMAAGRRRFVRAAAGLWATGCGCTGALLFGPWWQQQCGGEPFGRAAYVALLGCMGAAFGWAGGCWGNGSVRAWAAVLPHELCTPVITALPCLPACLNACSTVSLRPACPCRRALRRRLCVSGR